MVGSFVMQCSRRAVLRPILLPVLASVAAPPLLLRASVFGPAAGAALPPGVTPTLPTERRVGLAYSTWHEHRNWQDAPQAHRPWGTPELGYYRSDDPTILARHAEWISGAGVDFVVVDWSNNLGMDVRRPSGPTTQRFIERATEVMFDTWAALPSAPRIALMIGNPGDRAAVSNGHLVAKADEIDALFSANPTRAEMLERYRGKPLLLVYVGTPSPWGHGLPPWRDDRFTTRFMSGFLTQQELLLTPSGISRYGYWSWEDRGKPVYSVFQGHPECMTVVAAWRGRGSPGRDHGETYIRQWDYARRVGPRFVLGGTFNEWWLAEQESPEASKDIEPSNEFGWTYMDILKREAALFKRGR